MQLFVTYIVLFVTAVKARFSDFFFSIADPTYAPRRREATRPTMMTDHREEVYAVFIELHAKRRAYSYIYTNHPRI